MVSLPQNSSARRFFLLLLPALWLGLCPALAADPAQDLNTQLVFAVTAKSASEVKALIKQGADPNHAVNSAGVPALSLAVTRKDMQAAPIITALLDGKANVDIEDANGQTPLFYAAHSGNVNTAKLLMERGADAYHADNQKITARDEAFKEDHPEVTEAIDAFLKAKSQGIVKQYEERNQQIAERNQELADRNEQIAKQHEEIKQKLAAQRTDRQKKAAQETAEASKPKTVDKAALQSLIYDLSYHSCAAEYWRFCRANKQDTGMDRATLRNQMEAHKTLAAQAADKMRQDFSAKDAYIEKIATPSAQQVFDQLDHFGSNTERKDEGIGKKADLETRCADIADQWELAAPGMITPAAPKKEETDPAKNLFTPPSGANGQSGAQSAKPPTGPAKPMQMVSPQKQQVPMLQPNGMPISNPQILP